MSDGYSVGKPPEDPRGTRRVRILKAIVVKGHPDAECGKVLDVAWRLADQLITEGLAEEAGAEVPKVKANVIETREPTVETREPEMPPQRPSSRKPAK